MTAPRQSWQKYEPSAHYSPERWVHSDLWTPRYDRECSVCGVIVGVSRIPNSSAICELCAGELLADCPDDDEVSA